MPATFVNVRRPLGGGGFGDAKARCSCWHFRLTDDLFPIFHLTRKCFTCTSRSRRRRR